MAERVYILGGYQTDFSQNWARNGVELFDAFGGTVQAAFDAADLEPEAVEVAHVGNFAAELFCRQGHLGGFFAALHPAFSGLPASRHEAACASGSIAALSAAADIEAGRYGLAAVIGVEQMRNVPGEQAAEYIGGPAMWSGHEATDVTYPWPHMFSEVAIEYDNRYGIRHEHLAGIAKVNFANAKRNPNSQTLSKAVFASTIVARSPMAQPAYSWPTRKRRPSTRIVAVSASTTSPISRAGGIGQRQSATRRKSRKVGTATTSFHTFAARSPMHLPVRA
jgi:acetyl-CoA C-acetyltransferase